MRGLGALALSLAFGSLACTGSTVGGAVGEGSGESGGKAEARGGVADAGGLGEQLDPPPGAAAVCSADGLRYVGASPVLNDRQLRNTLRHVLGFDAELPTFPERPRWDHAYSTNHRSNAYSLTQVQRMNEVAEHVAAQVHDRIETLVDCDLATDTACAHDAMADFAGRAFRRPLHPEEAERLQGLYDAVVADGETPALAFGAVVAAVLQAPQFLYQLELMPAGDAPTYELTEHELASRLSYLLTDAPPDAELAALAASGELTQGDTLRRQATRLLDSEAGQAVLRRFALEWFDLSGHDLTTRFDPELAAAMAQEVERDLQAWLADDSFAVTGLLAESSTFVNARLAAHYGVDMPASTDADGWARISLPAHYGGGLLSRGATAARYSNLQAPSVIRRGVFVLTELLCQELGTPPNNAVELNPDLPPGTTPRERSAARNAISPCGGCHAVIDPVGLGMEEIDHMGRFRTTYDDGSAVDNAGRAPLLAEPEFAGTAELAAALVESDAFFECAAAQWAEYGFGQALPAHGCGGSGLVRDLQAGDGGYRALVLGLLQSDVFRARVRTTEAAAASDDGEQP